jgi:hypothetical protein
MIATSDFSFVLALKKNTFYKLKLLMQFTVLNFELNFELYYSKHSIKCFVTDPLFHPFSLLTISGNNRLQKFSIH